MKQTTNTVKKDPHKLGPISEKKAFTSIHCVLIPRRRRVLTFQNKEFLVKTEKEGENL